MDEDIRTMDTGNLVSMAKIPGQRTREYINELARRLRAAEADRDEAQRNDWTAALCDRINEIVRENRTDLHTEVTDGPGASAMIQTIHSLFNGRKHDRDEWKRRAEEAKKAIEDAHTVLHQCPELNMSNYNEDQVAELNGSMIEAFAILDNITSQQPTGGEVAGG